MLPDIRAYCSGSSEKGGSSSEGVFDIDYSRVGMWKLQQKQADEQSAGRNHTCLQRERVELPPLALQPAVATCLHHRWFSTLRQSSKGIFPSA